VAGREHTDPLEYIEVLRDPGAITARFDELQSSIKREILIFTKPPYAKPPQENIEGLDVVRKHQARSIYEFSVFDDPAVAEGVRRFIEQQLQPVVTRLGFRTAEFAWSRYTRWLSNAKGIELVERRLIPPLGHFSLVRFRKTEMAAAA